MQDFAAFVEKSGWVHSVECDSSNPDKINVLRVKLECERPEIHKGQVIVYQVMDTFNVGISVDYPNNQIFKSVKFPEAKELMECYGNYFKDNWEGLQQLIIRLKHKKENDEIERAQERAMQSYRKRTNV